MNGLGQLGINLANYQDPGMDGQIQYGSANTSEENLNDLSKALSAQHITGRETTDLTTASGAPLKVESLDKTLKLITFKESEIVLWKKIPKLQAFNTVEEYNQLSSYGAERGGFILEGELPVEEDSQYIRKAQFVKFMGVTKSVTHPMTLVNTMIGDAIAREAKNGAMYILRQLNIGLTIADSNIIPEEFNGLYAQQRDNAGYATLEDYYGSEVVVDLRGGTLQESHIEDAAEGIIENHGLGTDLFAPPKVLSDFVKNFYGNKFITPNTNQTAAGIMGQRVQEFDSQFGRIALNHDIFMNRRASKTLASAATHASAPATPVVGATPTAVTGADVPNSKWVTADAGDYFYAVSGLNRFGESALLDLGTAVTIANTLSADLQFASGGGANTPTGYRIYRSAVDTASAAASTFYPLFDVSVAELAAGYDGAAATKVRDRNRIVANTNHSFLIQNDVEVHAFRQLAPLMKMDLALISTAFRFMVLLYGTPLLFAPKKMVRFINIGTA